MYTQKKAAPLLSAITFLSHISLYFFFYLHIWKFLCTFCRILHVFLRYLLISCDIHFCYKLVSAVLLVPCYLYVIYAITLYFFRHRINILFCYVIRCNKDKDRFEKNILFYYIYFHSL